MNKNEFGKIIQKERVKQGITYRKLAELTGCTARSIQYWEQGQKSISLHNADKILKALGINMKIGI